MHIDMFFDSKIAICCTNEEEFTTLNDICEKHEVYWTGRIPSLFNYPITIYYDCGGDNTATSPFLNFVSGSRAMDDWGLPIVFFKEIQNIEIYIPDTNTFLELL